MSDNRTNSLLAGRIVRKKGQTMFELEELIEQAQMYKRQINDGSTLVSFENLLQTVGRVMRAGMEFSVLMETMTEIRAGEQVASAKVSDGTSYRFTVVLKDKLSGKREDDIVRELVNLPDVVEVDRKTRRTIAVKAKENICSSIKAIKGVEQVHLSALDLTGG